MCLYWSALRNCWIGRKCKTINPDGSIVTRECLERDINTFGKPMVDKVFEILEYFKPKWWWIENPQTGKMKRYIDEIRPEVNYVDVDYCKYGFPYKKRTRFWLSDTLKEFKPQLCKKDCGAMINVNDEGKEREIHIKMMGNTKYRRLAKIHLKNIGSGYELNEQGELELCNTKELRKIRREKLKNNPEFRKRDRAKHKEDVSKKGGSTNKLERYRIPEKLIEELLNLVLTREI